MSKNLTRKGLALGAIVALGTSLFAGAPAFAGTESTGVTLAPAAGTTYTSIKGAAFDLSTVVNSNILTSTVLANKLSYLVTNAGAAPVKVAFYSGLSTDVSDSIRTGDAADSVGSATTVAAPASAAALTAKAIVVKGAGDNVGKNSSSTGSNKLTLTSSTDGTDNVTFTVQAFIDENGNGQIDSFDLTSPARTVTFIPAANVTATTTIISSTIGTTKLQASVALGNDVNQANLAAGVVFVQFQKNGSNVAFSDSTVSTDATFDSTDAVLKTNKTTTGSAITADTYIAQAYFGSALATKLGSASNASVPVNGTLSADSTDFVDVTASANVKKVVTGNAANTATIRSGYTGNVTFSSTVKYRSVDGSTDYTAAGAGVTVKVTLTKVALASASTFTAGGKTLTATSGAQSFTVLTDADGKISFTGAGTGAADDSVAVTIDVLKKTGGYSAIGRGVTVTYAAAAVTSLDAIDLIGASAVRKATVGATYTANYAVTDQFAQLSAVAGSYRVKIEATGGTSAFTYYAPVVAGKASQTIVDNSTTAGSYTLRARLQKLNTTTNVWDNQLSDVDQTVVVNAVAAAAVSATASSSTAVATIAKTLVNADLRIDDNSQTATTIGYGTATQTISGTVTDATGAAVSGAVVTVTGAGLAFVVNGNVYTVGSATIHTGTNGQYSVAVYSTASGKTSVTVTSGAATKSVAIEFSGITAMAETNVISLDVASLSQVGRSVTVTVKLVDKFGNAVDTADGAIAVSVTGVGSLSAATVGTGTAGTATVQFVAGANDFGDAVITAKYTATDADATVVSATKTIAVGVTDAQVDVVKNRVTAVASFSKGKTVGFYVDGVKKWSKLSASDADVVLNYNLKKGRHTVTVKISGGFVTTEVIVVK
jgi:hypothetical protein